MELFISWSGTRSQEIAKSLRDWLPDVIQSVTPFVSSEDISKGSRWLTELTARLEQTSQGLVCVTPENTQSQWLNFEAGALAKSTNDASVRTVLFDIAPHEVVGPLAAFQASLLADRDDMRKVVESINSACPTPLSSSRLDRAFEANWPSLAEAIDNLPAAANPATDADRSVDDMVGEVLDRIRDMERRLPLPRLPQAKDLTVVPVSIDGQPPAIQFSVDGFTTGDRVVHDTFGLGVVTGIGLGAEPGGSASVTVDFENAGTKRLLPKHSPMRVVE